MAAMERVKSWWWAIACVVLIAAIFELSMGRSPICPCGHMSLWAGKVQSPENSQQLSDWYSFSHIIHGFLFYGAGWLVLRRQPIGLRLLAATIIEAGWEMLENSPIIIDRYRAATIAVGYSGDSVLNSMSDVLCMILGFAIARRLPLWATVALALSFELFTLLTIRDNLTLNVLMLVAPNDAIRAWQAGG
ncbi:DUF2585 domain-containing protein [Sphingomonas sp. RT2P30]|uniref:DUF2585 domain-containing protein n=1 Tax=Parasphingomonas halimpatiens TaxID=3096162 RepID=UPI002FCC10A4